LPTGVAGRSAWPRMAMMGKPGTPRPDQGGRLSTRTETPRPPRPGKVVGPRAPPNPTRRPRRQPTTLPNGAVGCTEGPWKERTRRTGPPRPHKQKTQRPGCRPRRPHMPRRSPTTRPTRAVGHAAPWGRRRYLARQRCLGLPQVAKEKGKTRQGVSAANFSPATQKSTHATHQGSGTRNPQGSVTLLSGAVLFGSIAEKKIIIIKSREYGAGRKRCQNFYQPRDPSSKKRLL
jgi:hypothetical protein